MPRVAIESELIRVVTADDVKKLRQKPGFAKTGPRTLTWDERRQQRQEAACAIPIDPDSFLEEDIQQQKCPRVRPDAAITIKRCFIIDDLPPPPSLSYRYIKTLVAKYYGNGLTVEDLESRWSASHVVLPRRVAMHLIHRWKIKEATAVRWSYRLTADQFGGRDHYFGLDSLRKFKKLLEQGPKYDLLVAEDVAAFCRHLRI